MMPRAAGAPVRVWRMTRAGAGDLNPTSFVARASSFASAAGLLGSVTLVVTRSEEGMAGFLLTPAGASSESAAIHLAQASNAKAVECDELPEVLADSGIAPVVGWLEQSRGSAAGRETQSGADPGEAARRLAVAMAPGQWVAVSLRPASRSEKRRHKRWLTSRLQTPNPTHHSVTSGAVVVSIRAGADDASEVSSLLAQVASAMPGFDVDTVARVARPTAASLAWAGGGVGVWAVSHWGIPAVLTAMGASPTGDLASDTGRFGALAACALGAVGACLGWGLVHTPGSRLAESATWGGLPAPRARLLPPKRPVKRRMESGDVVQLDGDYPLAPGSFMVAPSVVAGLVTPGAGALSGTSSTDTRPTPSALLQRVGPMVGEGANGGKVFLSAADSWSGIFLTGQAGSGKSALVRSLFAWNCLERVHPSGIDGWPGPDNALVAFESKGEGAAEYLQWADQVGDDAVLVDMADPASPAVDLFAVPGTVAERASFFANAMVYAFEAGSIQDRSFTTLVQVFTAALAVTPRVASMVAGVDPQGSPMYFAHLLLAGQGDETGSALAGAVMSEAVRLESVGERDESLSLARAALSPLFQGKSEAARRQFLEAPANKVAQLLAIDHWWGARRRKTTWQEVLDGHRALIVNTGTSTSGLMVDDRLSHQMSALLMFGLRDSIQRHCTGWQASGRAVSIFADELSLLTGSSAQVVTWLRNQGRSYGVRAVLATQYTEQLPEQVRTAVTGFSTIVAFAQDNVRVATELAADFAADGTEWVAADVVNLAPFTTIVRSTVDRQRQPAFTMHVRHFEEDREGFVLVQRPDLLDPGAPGRVPPAPGAAGPVWAS